MGEGIGVASNSKGHIFVNTCAQQTRNFEFDQNGNFVREIGKDSYGNVFCHGIRVDAQDNIWVIDEGSNLIIKYNPAGRAAMILGRRIGFPYTGMEPPVKEMSPAPPYIFNRPTDVAWDAAGNIFVADGYVNSRIAKYDKNGKFIKQVGTRGSGPAVHSDPRHCRRCPGQCLRWQPQRHAHRGVRQRSELQDHVRSRRRALVPVHHPRPAAISLHLKFQP